MHVFNRKLYHRGQDTRNGVERSKNVVHADAGLARQTPAARHREVARKFPAHHGPTGS